MILHQPHLLTKLEIFYPKYNGPDGWEVWISQSKAHHSSGVILIDFTKAKHLQGQRFCVQRDAVVRSPIGTNGKISVYKVPFTMLESWETPQEIYEIADNLWRTE